MIHASDRSRALWPVIVLALLGLLAGCNRKARTAAEPPVAIHAGDTSVTDGMYITRYPGPRGEGYLVGVNKVLMFGDLRGMFTYIRSPDVAHRLGALYVQDAARIEWAHPADAASSFIDARQAFYVAWQPLLGMMGPTLAPFATRAQAEAFQKRHGGALVTYREITARLAARLSAACPAPGAPLAAMAQRAGCVQGRGKASR